MLKSPVMLAPLVLGVPQMAELLDAEQPELDLAVAHARQTRAECSINACEAMIGRYERIFALPAGGKTLEERRAAVIFVLNSRQLVTPDYLIRLLEGVLFCHCELAEQFSEYRFTVTVEGENRAPDIGAAVRYIRLLKPAQPTPDGRACRQDGIGDHLS